MERVNFQAIEKKWQEKFTKLNLYRKDAKKYYCLEMFPYPSGKIHMGHVRNYTIGDVIARYKYLNGFNVLHPMGWDAFGLPAENASKIKNLLEGWPEKVKIMQKNWIGKSYGCEINFEIENNNEKINVFTTRPDTIFGASFIALSVDHKLSKSFINSKDFKIFKAECSKTGTTEEALANSDKLGFDTGLFAKHPFIVNKKIPIYFANFILMDYGTGAIFGCPAHDQRDFDFAKKYNLEIIKVVEDKDNKADLIEAFVGQGKIVNSEFLNGFSISQAKENIINRIEKMKIGKRKTLYRLKDWGISRQRYWGCPIPMIYLDDGSVVPVEKSELPIELPDDIDLNSHGNPLDKHPNWKMTIQKSTGKKAVRETDTLDTFVDSSWYFLRFCSPNHTSSPFSEQKANYWMPVDQYVGGIEHAILHLLYSRFFLIVLQKKMFSGQILVLYLLINFCKRYGT